MFWAICYPKQDPPLSSSLSPCKSQAIALTQVMTTLSDIFSCSPTVISLHSHLTQDNLCRWNSIVLNLSQRSACLFHYFTIFWNCIKFWSHVMWYYWIFMSKQSGGLCQEAAVNYTYPLQKAWLNENYSKCVAIFQIILSYKNSIYA